MLLALSATWGVGSRPSPMGHRAPPAADGRRIEISKNGRRWIRTTVGRSPADLQSALVGHLSILPKRNAERRESADRQQGFFSERKIQRFCAADDVGNTGPRAE